MSIEKVIVLEDDAIVRANLENFLRRQKFDVVTAPTLAIARDALGLFPDSPLKAALLEAVEFAIDRAH